MKSQKPHSASAPQQTGTFVIEVLRHEFSKRAEKNPQYSQRSFARQIGISHTLLSLLLNGHRAPSLGMIEKLSQKLTFPPDKTAALLESRGFPKNKAAKKPSKTTTDAIARYRKVSLDEFALLSEWQHYAILSLLEIADTEFEAHFIAKRLGIGLALAKISMQRLVDLKIVYFDEKLNCWKQKDGPIIVENTVSTVSTRQFQRQLLDKSVESLENDPIEIRDHSSMTFSMHPKHVPYALKRIRDFRRELTRELETFGEAQEVYNLTVQLFPTSRRNKS
jgi:uncharacterized protein (TIGR02147 family)